MVLGIELKALCMLGLCYTHNLLPPKGPFLKVKKHTSMMLDYMSRSMKKENGKKKNIFTFIVLSTNRHPEVLQ